MYATGGDSPVEYRCLSYTWGSLIETYEILLNGSIFRVNRNLYHFLQHAMRTFAMQSLWIDALCINQNDNDEKSKQVAHMGHIYHKAQEVLVWLGADPRGNLCAIMEYISSKPKINGIRAPEAVQRSWIAFCLLPYWKRAWITQEVLLGRRIRILCGSSSNIIDLDDVGFTIYWLSSLVRYTRPYELNGMRKNTVAVEGGSKSSGINSWTIRKVLWRQKGTDCSIARDRLFALLALACKGNEFRVSYEETSEDLFWRAGQHFQLWADIFYLNTLRIALNVEVSSLAFDMKNRTSYPLTMAFQNIHFQGPDYYPFDYDCGGCGAQFSRGEPCDIIICPKMKEERDVVDDRFTHILVKRVGVEGIEGAEDVFTITLNPYGAPFTLDLPPSALTYRTSQDQWASVTSWTMLCEKLKSEQLQPYRDFWMVHLPAEYAIKALEDLDKKWDIRDEDPNKVYYLTDRLVVDGQQFDLIDEIDEINAVIEEQKYQ